MELSAQLRTAVAAVPRLKTTPLSSEAARMRDCLGLPIAPYTSVVTANRAELRAHSERLNGAIQSRCGALPLWNDGELDALESKDLRSLSRTWRERIHGHPRWARALDTLVPRDDYTSIWGNIRQGDFDRSARGGDYTRGMASFQAGRWIGTRTLAALLGVTDADDELFLDVLGGDGYVWRVLQAEHALGTTIRSSLLMTNDISPHMFVRAGVWGMPTREDAASLSRTFSRDAFQGVLFAYGTHHIADLTGAVREAFRIMKPGGTIVLHDFMDEGPVGQWFHHVVDRYSKTGHDIAHVGPVRAAAALLEAGFRDVELLEIEDPFLFASPGGELNAIDVAASYLLGMYGMEDSFRGRREQFRALVETTLTYPETGHTPYFSDAVVYIPRRAVVAQATKPAARGMHRSESDWRLIHTIARLFRAPAHAVLHNADLPSHAVKYWFSPEGVRFGVAPERQQAFLQRFATA